MGKLLKFRSCFAPSISQLEARSELHLLRGQLQEERSAQGTEMERLRTMSGAPTSGSSGIPNPVLP